MLVCGAAPDRDIARGARDGRRRDRRDRAVRGGARRPARHRAAASGVRRRAVVHHDDARGATDRRNSSTRRTSAWWWTCTTCGGIPSAREEIARLGDRIAGYHVNDWLVPVKNVLMNRGMMGDGVIELRRIRGEIERAGYMGPIEVEIFNESIWETAARRARAADEGTIRGGVMSGHDGDGPARLPARGSAARDGGDRGDGLHARGDGGQSGCVRRDGRRSGTAAARLLDARLAEVGRGSQTLDFAAAHGFAGIELRGSAADDGSLAAAGVPAGPRRADEA